MKLEPLERTLRGRVCNFPPSLALSWGFVLTGAHFPSCPVTNHLLLRFEPTACDDNEMQIGGREMRIIRKSHAGGVLNSPGVFHHAAAAAFHLPARSCSTPNEASWAVYSRGFGQFVFDPRYDGTLSGVNPRPY